MVSLAGRGELSERFKELVLKTSDSERNLGFESLTLRQQKSLFCLPTKETFLSDAFLAERDAHFVRDVVLRSVMHACGA